MRAGSLARAAALVGFAWAAPLHAHGGLWRAEQIRVEPSDPTHIVVRSDSWGIVESRDGGKTWGWTCDEVALEDSLSLTRRPFAVAPGGNVLVGSGFDGLMIAKGSLCGFDAVPFFAAAGRCGAGACVPYDIYTEPAQGAVFVLTSSLEQTDAGSSYRNQLWQSADGGQSWSPVGGVLPTDVAASSVRVAPSDPATVYVGASTVTAQPTFVLLSSHDGGTSWSRTALPFTSQLGGYPAAVRLHGVHPGDPGTVFVWLDQDSGIRSTTVQDGGLVGAAPDVLFVSTDGGTTVHRVLDGRSDLPGFAVSTDGTTVLVGATEDGLLAATMSDVRSGSASPFHRVNAGPTWGLSMMNGELLAGRNDYGSAGEKLMSIGRSVDLGVTFESFMGICGVQPATCPAGTPGHDQCPGLFYGYQNFQADMQALRCTAPDAGAPARRAEAGGGCAVARGPGRSGWGCVPAVSAALLTLLRRCRAGRARLRRDRRPCPPHGRREKRPAGS